MLQHYLRNFRSILLDYDMDSLLNKGPYKLKFHVS